MCYSSYFFILKLKYVTWKCLYYVVWSFFIVWSPTSPLFKKIRFGSSSIERVWPWRWSSEERAGSIHQKDTPHLTLIFNLRTEMSFPWSFLHNVLEKAGAVSWIMTRLVWPRKCCEKHKRTHCDYACMCACVHVRVCSIHKAHMVDFYSRTVT